MRMTSSAPTSSPSTRAMRRCRASPNASKRDDRARKPLILDEGTARRVSHIESAHETLAEDLNAADARGSILEDEPLRAPAGRRLHVGPAGGLKKVRARRLMHEPVPVARVVRCRRPCPHRGPSLCGVFAWRRVGRRELARREGAFGVALASVEHRATPSAAPDELAFATFGAHDAGLLLGLLDVLAVRVSGAADERAEAAAAPRERLAALGADLAFENFELRLLLSFERLGVITRTLREWLALLPLFESGARVDAPGPTELDHDWTPALGTDAVGRLLGDVRLLHALRLLFDELAERLEEVAHDGDPLDLARGDPVEILFHAHGEAGVDDVGEVLVQEVGHDEADVLGE